MLSGARRTLGPPQPAATAQSRQQSTTGLINGQMPIAAAVIPAKGAGLMYFAKSMQMVYETGSKLLFWLEMGFWLEMVDFRSNRG